MINLFSHDFFLFFYFHMWFYGRFIFHMWFFSPKKNHFTNTFAFILLLFISPCFMLDFLHGIFTQNSLFSPFSHGMYPFDFLHVIFVIYFSRDFFLIIFMRTFALILLYFPFFSIFDFSTQFIICTFFTCSACFFLFSQVTHNITFTFDIYSWLIYFQTDFHAVFAWNLSSQFFIFHVFFTTL